MNTNANHNAINNAAENNSTKSAEAYRQQIADTHAARAAVACAEANALNSYTAARIQTYEIGVRAGREISVRVFNSALASLKQLYGNQPIPAEELARRFENLMSL